jgi:hypothetical protein
MPKIILSGIPARPEPDERERVTLHQIVNDLRGELVELRRENEVLRRRAAFAGRKELLAALRWMTDEFLSHIKFNPNGGDADAFHAYLNQARIVIAKAEGRGE